jgi:ATP-dependent Clp protease, protease subunit
VKTENDSYEISGVFSGIPEIPIPPWIPEVPYPFTPDTPRYEPRSAPIVVPIVDDARSLSPRQRLYEQRRVLATGALDAVSVSALVATLMALDGLSEHPVELILCSQGGPMSSASLLLDSIALMTAPVDVLCIGSTAGTATAIASCASGRRRMTSQATLSLLDPVEHTLHGPLWKVASTVADLTRIQVAFGERVVARTHMSLDEVLRSFRDGQTMSASEALTAGFVDEVVAVR